MTCKLNLIIFLVFVGVLGLNFYVDNESVDTKNSSHKPKIEFATANSKSLINVSKAKVPKVGNYSSSKADTIASVEKLN